MAAQPTPEESHSDSHPKVPLPKSAPESTPITSPPTIPENYEEQNVHAVYEQIASHFSSTRYKAWPIVKTFLQNLSPGSIGLDIGCGNGKYLLVNPDVFIVGSDRSTNLAKIASAHQPHSAIVADTLALPHPEGKFDFAISIAVIHHLSTPARRREAVSSILATLSSSSGKALIYVWALEQSSSRRGWDSTNPQDVMVPWVMRTGKKVAADGSVSQPASEKTFQRYYHLYRAGELEEDIKAVGGVVVESGYEKDNYRKRPAQNAAPSPATAAAPPPVPPVQGQPPAPTPPAPQVAPPSQPPPAATEDANAAAAAVPPPAKKSRTNTPWTPQEELRLKQMRDAGNSWAEIAKTFPTRTEGSVKKHWYKDMHYAEFAEDESQALLNAIKEYENNKWKVIGQKVGKPAKACEQYAKEHFPDLFGNPKGR